MIRERLDEDGNVLVEWTADPGAVDEFEAQQGHNLFIEKAEAPGDDK